MTREVDISFDNSDTATHRDEEKEKRVRRACIIRNVWMAVVWTLATGIMIVFTVQISSQYGEALRNPASTVSYNEENLFTLPQVTICNFNQVVPNTTLDDCPFCRLELHSCQSVQDGSDCSPLFKYKEYETPQGTFICFEFNNDPNNVTTGVNVGYNGAYITIFAVEIPPPDDTLRIGLQATFGIPGSVPDVFREYRFAAPHLDTFYAIRKVQTQFLNETDPSKQGPFTRFENEVSLTGLPKIIGNYSDDTDFIGISFTYQTTSIELITFDTSYSLNNFFGDFAGMLGTLMGLDVVKVAAAFPVVVLAYRKKNFELVQDHFNG